MPSKKLYVEQVASQMMKGPRGGRLTATQKQKDNFLTQHRRYIDWAVKQVPWAVRGSAAIPAVVVKCMIKYDKNIVSEFCKSLRGVFQGQNDPAYLLWKLLSKPHDKSTTEVYQYTVCAAKAYMERRTLNTLRPVREDIFDWDEGYTVPDNLLSNWTSDRLPGEDEELAIASNTEESKVG